MSRDAKSLFRDRLGSLQGNMSNVEFARKCGLNTQDIQRYSRGLATPTIEKLVLIATAFSVSVDWLLGLSSSKTQSQEIAGTKHKIVELKRVATQVCADADSLLNSLISLENLATQ